MTKSRRQRSKEKRERRAKRRQKKAEAAEALAKAEAEAESIARRRTLPWLLVLALPTCAAIAWRGIHLRDPFAVMIVGTMACVTGFCLWLGFARGYFPEKFGKKIHRNEDPFGFWFCVFIHAIFHALCIWALFTGTARPLF